VLEHTALEAAAGKAFERLEPGVAGKVSWLVTRAAAWNYVTRATIGLVTIELTPKHALLFTLLFAFPGPRWLAP
jgi:hypothetical protein